MDIRVKQSARKRPPQPPEPPSRARVFLRRHGKTLLLIALVAIFIHALLGENGFLAMRRSQMEVDKLEQDIQKLREENQRLSGEVEALKTDPKMIEKIAREEMGLTKPEEYIFKLPPEKQAPEKKKD